MSITFNDEAAVVDYFAETGVSWLSLVSADGLPYLATETEDGEVFTQTFPSEDEEGAAFRGGPINSGTLFLGDQPHGWYPVKLVAPLPLSAEGSE